MPNPKTPCSSESSVVRFSGSVVNTVHGWVNPLPCSLCGRRPPASRTVGNRYKSDLTADVCFDIVGERCQEGQRSSRATGSNVASPHRADRRNRSNQDSCHQPCVRLDSILKGTRDE